MMTKTPLIVFRVDASLLMGSGHVMRCLTLAKGLKAKGRKCVFLSRDHIGNLCDFIGSQGFDVVVLPSGADDFVLSAEEEAAPPAHAAWLGCTWATDADQSKDVVAGLCPDWLVVDHYALDARWEEVLRPHCKNLLVIDDLADRPHDCDILVDQNLGRRTEDYALLLPRESVILSGPQYALLREEFATLRNASLDRRRDMTLNKILVTMGGVDQPNATAQALIGLRSTILPESCRVNVVMGIHSPWLEDVRRLAHEMPWKTEVYVGVSNMAELMAESDLAIGAAGSTSWERCCLGLPTLLAVIADNQAAGAVALHKAGAAIVIGNVDTIAVNIPPAVEAVAEQGCLARMSDAAKNVTCGRGVNAILEEMGL